jgi:hypothetical protein
MSFLFNQMTPALGGTETHARDRRARHRAACAPTRRTARAARRQRCRSACEGFRIRRGARPEAMAAYLVTQTVSIMTG